MRYLIIIILIFFNLTETRAQKPEMMTSHYQNEWQTFREMISRSETAEPDTNIDVKFYHLSLDISIDAHFLAASARCVLQPVNNGLGQFRLDLHQSMIVDSISGPVESFQHAGNTLDIFLSETFDAGETIDILIYYHGEPQLAGGYKGMRYETHGNNEPIVATLSTPYLAHYWFPCKDGPTDKADSVYVDVIVPDAEINGISVKGISNGLLEGVETINDKKIFKWRHRYPIVTYYVMAAVSNYQVIEEEYTGIHGEQYPLVYYVFNESYTTALAGVEDMPIALDVFSELFGIYPFHSEKYGMTQLGYYGAIENQTNTIINNMSTGWFMISAHELSHMWFGDMITCADWHHGWLNEGFATYAEALYVESQQGHNAYLDYLDNEQYFQGGTLYLQNAQDTFNIFQPIIYSKGSYVLHMLRSVIGDEKFFEGIKSYATNPGLIYGNATTEDLQNVMESVSGMDLEFFFEEWVYDAYYPTYEYNYQSDVPAGKGYISLVQIQESFGRRPVFEMPVQVRIYLEDVSDTLLTLWNNQQAQTFEIDLASEITDMDFDPDGWLLDEADYNPGLPVGIVDNEQIHRLNILPNPAHNEIIMSTSGFSEKSKISIYSITGKKVLNADFKNPTQAIDISGLKSGIYILKIWDSELILQTKFIKE